VLVGGAVHRLADLDEHYANAARRDFDGGESFRI